MKSSKQQSNQEIEVKIYKTDIRKTQLPSSVLDLSYLKRLFDTLQKLSTDAVEYEINQLKRDYFLAPEEFDSLRSEKIPETILQKLLDIQGQKIVGEKEFLELLKSTINHEQTFEKYKSLILKYAKQSDQDFEKIKNSVRNLYRITVQIQGSKGEYILSQDKSIFEEDNLPDKIKYISLDSYMLYKHTLNSEPVNSIKIEFDFAKPDIFDFLTQPSEATTNHSYVQVSGQNATWVQGAYNTILSSLEKRTTNRAWLHRRNVYDILLMIFGLPLIFMNLYKLDSVLNDIFENLNQFFTITIHIYMFFIFLYIFMIVFKYSRWLFSYMELKDSLKDRAALHRSIFFTIILAVIANIITLLIT